MTDHHFEPAAVSGVIERVLAATAHADTSHGRIMVPIVDVMIREEDDTHSHVRFVATPKTLAAIDQAGRAAIAAIDALNEARDVINGLDLDTDDDEEDGA